MNKCLFPETLNQFVEEMGVMKGNGLLEHRGKGRDLT